MVTAAKPKIGGAISRAPLNTTLPTTAVATLAEAFKNLGYVADSGLSRSIAKESEDIKAWGGDTVYVLDKGKKETFKFVMLNSTDPEVLKTVHGDANVSGTSLASGISVISNNSEQTGHAYVIDMIESENTLHRIVIPNGVVTEIEDINYVDSDVLGYGVTISAIADSSGNTAYEYMQTAATSGT